MILIPMNSHFSHEGKRNIIAPFLAFSLFFYKIPTLFFLSMAFTLDRVDAAKRLGVSTRTIDRYIQAGRIRTRRIGKKMFLEEDDVEEVRLSDPSRREEDYIVIMDEKADDTEIPLEGEIIDGSNRQVVSHQNQMFPEFLRLYDEVVANIAKKDEIIQDLSYRLGKSETELKNSIPLVEYKKTSFLLESAKSKSDSDAETLSTKVQVLEKEISKRNSMIL